MGIKVTIGSAFFQAGDNLYVSRSDFEELLADPSQGMTPSAGNSNYYMSADGKVIATVLHEDGRERFKVRTNKSFQVSPA